MMKKMATREAYGEALRALGEENPDVVVLDADLSKSTKTSVFAKQFPERFFDMGIAEQNMIGTAAGLAAAGKIPFASTFAVFATGRAYEQIRNSVCYPQLNVKIAATHAGLTVGEDGASHQALEDISLMRTLPHMTVVVPCDPEQTVQAVQAVAAVQGPVYLRLGRPAVEPVFDENYRFEIGKGVQLTDGDDVAIIATGLMTQVALQAAQQLSARNVAARVINISTIKPIDRALIVQAAKETGALVTAEEHSIIGGLGSAVAEVLAEYAPAPLQRVGVQDCFGESGKPSELLGKYHLTVEDVVAAVMQVMTRK